MGSKFIHFLFPSEILSAMIKQTAAALLDKPIQISISWYRPFRFHAIRKIKSDRTFAIHPPFLGTLIQFSDILEGVETDFPLPQGLSMEKIYWFAERHCISLATIAALAIQNKQEQLPDPLIRQLEANIKPYELSSIYKALADLIDVSTFYQFYQLHRKQDPEEDKTESSPGTKTLWGVIGGMIKYFRFSWNEIMWEISYRNIMMLSATIPSYKTKKEKKGSIESVNDRELNSGDELANFLGLKI